MSDLIKDEYFENLAHQIADAISNEDGKLYSHLMASSEVRRRGLGRRELIELRERVHYLAENKDEIQL